MSPSHKVRMRVILSILALAAILLIPSVASATADDDIDRVICGLPPHAEAAILSSVADDAGVSSRDAHAICPLSRSGNTPTCPMGSGSTALMNCCCLKGAPSHEATESTLADRSAPSATLSVSVAPTTDVVSPLADDDLFATDRIDGLDTPPPERRLLSL